MKTILLNILILASTSVQSFSQSIGGAIMGNPQTESIGLNLRGDIPFSFIHIVPQFSYYPFFNKVSEYYIGASLHLDFLENSSAKIYAIAHASYNTWMNYEESPLQGVKPNNIVGEFGIGMVGTKCISPFAEFRYNAKWKETNAQIGVLIKLNCGNASGGGSYHTGGYKSVNCPGR